MILEDMAYEELLEFAKRFVVRPNKDFEEVKAGQDYIINQDQYFVDLYDLSYNLVKSLTYKESEQCLN